MYKYICAYFIILIITVSLFSQEKSKITSLSLKDAIEIAIKNHPEIQKSRQNVEAAKGRHLKDISLPPLSLSLSNEYIKGGTSLSNFDERTIEISQEFDFPSVYFAKNSRGNAEINSFVSGLEQTTNFVRIEVKRAYYTALAKYQLLKIAEENINIANEFFKKAEIRYKVGEVSNLELLTAKVHLSEAKSCIETAKKEYNSAVNILNFALGFGIQLDFANIKFLDSLAYNKLNLVIEELLNKSLQINPNLKKVSYELESSEINRQIAWMNLIPSFNASYMLQTRAGVSDYYGVKLGINFPLWFIFDQRGQLQETKAINQYYQFELQNIKNTILSKINDAYIDFVNDEKQLNLYQNELIPQAEEIFRTAELSYQAGEITYLEFLQAKFTTINAKTNLIKSLFDYKEAIINLEVSTGITIE